MSLVRVFLSIIMSAACATAAGCARPAWKSTQIDTCLSGQESCKVHGYGIGSGDQDAPLGLPPSVRQFSTALSASPEIKAAQARSLAARSAIESAKAMSRPSVAFTASSMLLDNQGPNYGHEQSYGLTVDVPLYQGGRDKATLDLATSDYRASISNAEEVLVDNAFSLIAAHLEIKRQDRSLAILAEHRTALSRLKRSVISEESEGSATRVDVKDVEQQLLQIDLASKRATLNRVEAERTIARLDAPQNLDVDTVLPRLSAKLSQHLPDLVEKAIRDNPQIATRIARIDAAQARVSQASAAYNPSLSLSLSINAQRERFSAANNDTRAMLNFTAPLYSGGARKADIYGRNQELLAASLDRDSALLNVRATVQASFNRLAGYNEMLSLSQNQLAVTQARFVGVKTERKLGERTVYDEIRAIADIANARTAVTNAQYDAEIAKLTLAAQTGTLSQFIKIRHSQLSQRA